MGSNYTKILFYSLILLFSVLFSNLLPLFYNEIPAGWDASSHYLLYTRFWELLAQGHFSGYIQDIYAGFPAFKLYPPFFYFWAGLPKLISFGFIPATLSFNISLVVIILLIIFSLYLLTKEIADHQTGLLAAVLVVCSFFMNLDHAFDGIGLGGFLYVGLYPNFLALAIYLFFLTFLIRIKQNRTYVIWSGLLFGLIILTHNITSIIAFITLSFYLLFHKSFINYFTINIIAFIISGFWIIEFLNNYNFSNSIALGINKDPLSILFPDLNRNYLINFSLSNFPIISLLFFTGLCVGIMSLLKKQKFFIPLHYFFILLLLPRNFLLQYFDFEIHYKRFAQYIFYFQLPIIAVGIQMILANATNRDSMSSYLKTSLSKLFIVILFLSVIIKSYFYDFSWLNNSDKPFLLTLNKYPKYKSANQIIKQITQFDKDYRVVTESTHVDKENLGSPHFFSAIAPLSNIQIIPGLFFESSLSSIFINSSLALYSGHIVWGAERLSKSSDFLKLSVEDVINRLALFSAGYVISSSKIFYNTLYRVPSDTIKLIRKNNKFAVFEITNKHKKFELLDYKPWLFLDYGGMNYQEFSLEWFKNNKLIDFPLIYTEHGLKALSAKEKKQLGGIVISVSKFNRHIIEEIKSLKKEYNNLIILTKDKRYSEDLSEYTILSANNVCKNYNNMINFSDSYLKLLQKQDIKNQSIRVIKEDGHSLRFNANGAVAIRYSYAPGWKSKNKTVFQLNPSLMFVFADGLTELKFD